MAMYAKVRRLRLRDGLSISEIARRTSLSRNTIKAWLREPARREMKYKRTPASKKLDVFEAWLRHALEVDARRPRSQRRTARRLHEQLKAEGFTGHYARVTEAIRAWRAQAGAVTARSAYVPLTFAWGEAFQFDWSEEGIVIGGIWRRVQVAHMKLCASRAFWLVAYPSQGHEMLFDAHARCFVGLGGVARRGIYDNMKTAVDRVPGRGKARIVNARFAAMAAHYLFDPDFCNVASGWEKGRVEKNVQDARRRIWQTMLEQRFASFADLNVYLATQCVMTRNAAHPEHPELTIAEALEHEQAHLMPMPASFDGYVELPVRVSSTSLITVARNRYSVPCAYAGHRVSVRLYPERLVVVADQEVIAEHARVVERDRVVYDRQHYLPLVERKPGALRNGAVRPDARTVVAPEPRAATARRWRPRDGSGVGSRAGPPKNRFLRALLYARERRAGLELFLTDPDVPIDNNHLERRLRAIPMGRKNWLFCWTELGAKQVGIIQSLLVTCRLHDIDPYTYLVDVLQRVGQHPASRVAELTPRLWKDQFAANPLRSLLYGA